MKLVPSLAPLVLVLAPLACFAPTVAEEPLPGPLAAATVFAREDRGHERFAEVSTLLDVGAREAATWITDPAHLERWLAEDVEFGAVGGPFAVAWPSQGKSWHGTLIALEPERGILVADVGSERDGRPIRLEFDRVEEAGYQRVRLVIGPFGVEMVDEVVAAGYREGLSEAFGILRRAAAGEPTEPIRVPVVEREFHPLETPSEGLEAESELRKEIREDRAKKP
jgi:uncharacterized protein YndB with AHSA1/START domain